MAADGMDPFLYKDPPLFESTASSIIDETRALIDGASAVCNNIIALVKPEEASFENTLQPLIENENARSARENYLRFYASTSPSKELRDASHTATSMFNEAEADFLSQRDIFVLIDSVMQKAQSGSPPLLDDEAMYYLSKLHQRFSVNGCGIVDEARRTEFVAKKKRIAELARECRKNMADERTGLWLTREELDGVPESHLKRLTKGDGKNAGYLWLSTKVPFSGPAIETATNPSTRKRIHYAIMNRLPQNIPLFREMTLLRDETARMLGWPNHFAFKTSQRMVRTPGMVYDLMAEMRAALAPVAEESTAELLLAKKEEAAAREESLDDMTVFFWEREYYQKKVDQKAGLFEAKVSEYFELDTTLGKLLDIYEHLFGVRMIPVDHSASAKRLVWHGDVRMFAAWNVDGEQPEFLAYCYLDLFPREGKYTHVGHYTLQRRYQRPDGSWHDPCSCLIMNYIKATADKPTLLDLNSVRKLFHELGHMYHCILSRARYAALHSVDTDFVETPSLMLEQFFWDPQVIRDVSQHYSYLNPLTHKECLSILRDDEKKHEQASKMTLQQATEVAENRRGQPDVSSLRNFFFATYDILIHSPASHEDLEKTNLCELFNKTRTEVFRSPGGEAQDEGWEFAQGQTTFRGILGKYDAGYYAYILGRLFALNIFQAGFSSDLMSKENARRYRDMVLCKGGSQPEMKTLVDFLGHEPRTKPYLEWLRVKV